MKYLIAFVLFFFTVTLMACESPTDPTVRGGSMPGKPKPHVKIDWNSVPRPNPVPILPSQPR